MLPQQRLHLFQMRHRNCAAACRVVGQFYADIGDLRRISIDFGLQRGKVQIAFVQFVGTQIEDHASRHFLRRESLVDLVENRAGEQQILRHPSFLLPCLAEDVFGRTTGLGQREMLEREYLPKARIDIDGALQLREQTRHLLVDGRHAQLRPRVGLQIEDDVFGREVLRVESGAEQRLRTHIAFDGRACQRLDSRWLDGSRHGDRCGRLRCDRCTLDRRIVDLAGRRVGDHHDDVDDVVGLARVGGAAQEDILVFRAELVLELQIAGVVEDVLLTQFVQDLLDFGIGGRRIAELDPVGAAKAEQAATFGDQRFNDVDDGEFQTAQRHVGAIEFEIHQITVAASGHRRDQDHVLHRIVDVGQEDPVLAIKRAGEDLGFDDVDQRVHHRPRTTPLIDDRRDCFRFLRVAAADVLLGPTSARLGEFGDLVAQSAHRLPFERERLQIDDTLHHAEGRRSERLAIDRRQRLFRKEIELQIVPGAVAGQLCGERQEAFFRAGIAVREQDALVLAAVEEAALLIAEEQQRRDHQRAARHRGFVLVLMEDLVAALPERRISVQAPVRDQRRRCFDGSDRRLDLQWRRCRRGCGHDRNPGRIGVRALRGAHGCRIVLELARQHVRMLLDEVLGEIVDIEVLEQQSLRQSAKILFEPFQYFQHMKRIDAHLAERCLRIEHDFRVRCSTDQRLEVVLSQFLQNFVVHHRSSLLIQGCATGIQADQ